MTSIPWRYYGERGVLLELDSHRTISALHRAVSVSGLVVECVPGAAALYVEPSETGPHGQRLVDAIAALTALPADVAESDDIRTHTIPVTYDGVDLDDVAALAGLSVDDVIARHSSADYTVAFLGFSRGFPYLIGLDERLVVPRLASPRTSVPAGSVAIGGALTGIYPAPSPGGWRLLGHTTETFFDERRDPPSVFSPGDIVRFVVCDDPPETAPAATMVAGAVRSASRGTRITVVDSGPLLLLQDWGRPGYAHQGVARSGAFDRDAQRRANRIVGNSPDVAVFEALLGSCEFVVEPGPGDGTNSVVVVAVSGARVPVTVNDRPVGNDVAIALHAGDHLRIGMPTEGLRAYLAVRGGIEGSPVLGSCSYDSLGRIGPAPFVAGDEIVGAQCTSLGNPWYETVPTRPIASTPILELFTGPRREWLDDDAHAAMTASTWTVDAASDRTGVRLNGPKLARAAAFETRELPSEAMIPGAVQVPPNGQPIILGPDCGTTGGYPVIGVVSAASLNLVGQLRPGQSVRFRQTASRPGSIG